METTDKAIWQWLKGLKGYRHWEECVKFTAEELKVHLESKFTSEMNWSNYGSHWEVDHIKPVNKCNSFDEAWDINNLQPLTCVENRSKGDKYDLR